MRVIFSIIGAVFGFSLTNSSHELFGVVLGALAGFGAAEFAALRVRLKKLEDELGLLRKSVAQQARPEAERTATPSPVRPVAPAPDPPTSQPGSPPAAGGWEPYGGSPGAAPVRPAAVSRPGPIVRIVRDYFPGGNTLVRVG